MPVSIFKSRPKPKSDPRLQWKALKAKHAKTISVSKVEVGLGKALDAHQKQVDAVLLLDGNQLTAAAFAPVLATAATVKRLAVGLEPKVKGNTDYTTFLAALKKDADWWTKVAKDIKSAPDHVSNWNTAELTEALNNLQKLNTCIVQLNTVLKNASKKTQAYTPPKAVTDWLAVAQKLKPVLAKLSVLSKNRTGNFKLIVELLQPARADIQTARTDAGGLAIIRNLYPNLPPVADWDEVESLGKDADSAAFMAAKAIGRFRD